MESVFLSFSQLITLGAGLIGVLVGSGISAWTTRKTHRERVTADRELAERKFEFDMELAERKFAFDTEIAERKFKYDRELHDHKRRVELAEELVAGFHQLGDVIAAVRSPLGHAGEGQGRPRGKYETEEQARQRDTYYVTLARLKNNGEFISSLMSKRYRARALFGADIDQSFQDMQDVLVAIHVSADTLIRLSGASDRTRDNDDIWNECERDIWRMSAAGDPLDRKLCHASEIVEAVCRPILETRL